MTRTTKQRLTALTSGLLFGVGLVLGGMTDPAKVIKFLDVGGHWDPSLAFVMLGAVAVHFVAYRWVVGNAGPLFADDFALPSQRHIDRRLVGGSALFGIGWGLAGYCPGPAIVSLGAGGRQALIFVVAMFAGMFAASRYQSSKMASAAAERDAPGTGVTQAR